MSRVFGNEWGLEATASNLPARAIKMAIHPHYPPHLVTRATPKHSIEVMSSTLPRDSIEIKFPENMEIQPMAEAKVHTYKFTLAKRAPFEATVILKPSREMKMGTEHKVVLTHKVDNQVVGGITLNVRITPALNMPDTPPNALASLQQYGSLPFYKFLREWGIERIEVDNFHQVIIGWTMNMVRAFQPPGIAALRR